MDVIKREMTLYLCPGSSLEFSWYSYAGMFKKVIEKIDGMEGTYKITIEKVK